jgi:pre-rRNA-processing protein TSR1
MMEDDMDAAISVATTEKRGVLLDDHHYFSDDETHMPAIPKRLPKGTSAYQAAWFLGDNFSDSGSDYEDVDEQGDVSMDAPALPQDGIEGFAPREPTEAAPTEYPQSEMFLDPTPDDEAEQLAAFRGRKGDEAEDDREFPDEIELHPQVLARERLARYRGLKSLRTSHWEEAEDRAHEPENWRRLLQVPDYKSARSQVTREALVGGVTPGTRVHIHLRNVPISLRSSYNPFYPLNLFSLLRHEHKRAVLNFNITLSSDYPEPIKSKQEIIMQCGPRRFVINPLFSQGGNTSNDVHKFDRYLHPGRSAIATFVAPLTWGSVPTLFFKRTAADGVTDKETWKLPLTLIGTGTSLPPSSSRVIAKRIILTGHPYKIHKKLVTIRYMFFNREDVEWFKALQLWTKRGRSGFIKESLGTHGYFKATFDGKINPQDSVGVSLYKRMWPRNARTWNSVEGVNDEAKPVAMEVDTEL